MKSRYDQKWEDYILEASQRLAELDIKIHIDNLAIELLRFWLVVRTEAWSFRRHKNSSFFFYVVISGKCKFILNEKEFEVGAGEFYFSTPNTYYQPIRVGNEKLIMFWVNLDFKLLDDNLTEAYYVYNFLKNSPCKNYRGSSEMVMLIEKIFREVYQHNFGFYNNIKSILSLLLNSFVRSMVSGTTPSYNVPLKTKKNDERYQQIKLFIEENVNRPITITEIAKHMFLSDKQVYRIIMDKKEVSTKKFIEGIKLEKAKRLLKESNYTIKQISDLLGFSSTSYFIQFFKKNEDITPSMYRKIVTIIV